MTPVSARRQVLVGVTIANLDEDGVVQPSLPFDAASTVALDTALDDVRRRFGSTSITRAVLLGRDPGMSVPLWPDGG